MTSCVNGEGGALRWVTTWEWAPEDMPKFASRYVGVLRSIELFLRRIADKPTFKEQQELGNKGEKGWKIGEGKESWWWKSYDEVGRLARHEPIHSLVLQHTNVLIILSSFHCQRMSLCHPLRNSLLPETFISNTRFTALSMATKDHQFIDSNHLIFLGSRPLGSSLHGFIEEELILYLSL